MARLLQLAWTCSPVTVTVMPRCVPFQSLDHSLILHNVHVFSIACAVRSPAPLFELPQSDSAQVMSTLTMHCTVQCPPLSVPRAEPVIMTHLITTSFALMPQLATQPHSTTSLRIILALPLRSLPNSASHEHQGVPLLAEVGSRVVATRRAT